eukprot:354988-Chlamydomonas_euryale.AAC.24
MCHIVGLVAQWIAHQASVLRVAGSSPAEIVLDICPVLRTYPHAQVSLARPSGGLERPMHQGNATTFTHA